MKTFATLVLVATALSLQAQEPVPVPVPATTETTTTTVTLTEVEKSAREKAANALLRDPEELFRRLDANADGVLSTVEFQTIYQLADDSWKGPNTGVTLEEARDARVSPAPVSGTAAGTNSGSPTR